MKKRILALPVAALVAVGFVACSDAPTGLAPDGPNFELTGEFERVEVVNRHVYGEFYFEFPGGSGGVQAIQNGPGNWKGNLPKNAPGNANWCVEGLWYNPQGKPTTGSDNKPHPHCLDEAVAQPDLYVVLEPISAHYNVSGSSGNKQLTFTSSGTANYAVIRDGGSGNPKTEGLGEIRAHAVLRDEATGLPSQTRVGVITIALTQYTGTTFEDLFDSCEYDFGMDGLPQSGCLNHPIKFDYVPNAVGGAGVAVTGQTGFLWWTIASDYWRND